MSAFPGDVWATQLVSPFPTVASYSQQCCLAMTHCALSDFSSRHDFRYKTTSFQITTPAHLCYGPKGRDELRDVLS